MLTDELLAYLFDGRSHVLGQPMARWLASSRRFTAFVTAFQDKIRKKLRTTQDREGLLDLWLELETAYLLLQEKSLSLVYEPEHAGHVRSPDFGVTFTTSLTFLVEVTRVRADQSSTPGQRLADTVCAKLGQLLPQRSNVLLVAVEGPRLTDSDLRATMLRLQRRAEQDDSMFLHRRGFRDRADFFRCYRRLSEILARETPLQAGEPAALWANPRTTHPLPARVRTALARSHQLRREV